jgi:hypothetical protein
MTRHHPRIGVFIGAFFVVAALNVSPDARASGPESQRLERAKDLIGDEQWVRAIDELKGAIADQKEPNKDEALFWLAHSENQTRDTAAAVATIRRLERDYPASRWVKPARSLRIEIARRLQRNDVLWYTAVPPVPPAVPVPPSPMAVAAPPAPATPPTPPAGATPSVPPAPAPAAGPRGSYRSPPPPQPAALPPAPFAPAAVPRPPMPPTVWMPDTYFPDTDLRIQALGSLIDTDAGKVIPMLKQIALDGANPSEARRALFVLAQSGRADARSAVVDVAKTGSAPVRLAAARELGRLGGPAVVNDLLQVYSTGNQQVKYQIVSSLGQRDAAPALMRIAQSESDQGLRDVAIVTLGQAGGRAQLVSLYARASVRAKHPIIVGLFNAQADDELIQLAEREHDPRVRQEIISQLRLLGTPRVTRYLEQTDRK